MVTYKFQIMNAISEKITDFWSIDVPLTNQDSRSTSATTLMSIITSGHLSSTHRLTRSTENHVLRTRTSTKRVTPGSRVIEQQMARYCVSTGCVTIWIADLLPKNHGSFHSLSCRYLAEFVTVDNTVLITWMKQIAQQQKIKSSYAVDGKLSLVLYAMIDVKQRTVKMRRTVTV